jgi:hypothetical protein
MVRGILVEPDKGVSRVKETARFSVPAEMPRAYVTNVVYPEMAKEWIAAYEKRGYTLDSAIYLYPREYAHIDLPGNGTVGKGKYEHDEAARIWVDRCMVAWWRVKDIVIDLLPESEKAAIRAQVKLDLDHEHGRFTP